MTPALLLALLGLVDASFSGFRAYAGRDARIRKRRATARAALRGLSVGSVLLLAPVLTAVTVLLTASDRAATFDTLVAGALGYLLPLTLYTAVVLVSLLAYFLLPFRASTLAVVIGLGPLTLLRPLALAAACAGALMNGGGPPSLLVGVIAGAAVLCVEPVVHRRWYARVS
ncbi:hypothetical protein ACF09L_32245 [Streptomyces sp. NPDC014779]|uniref:hypothetical protein n=1 Tax=unclassified Streptomyces TaxID=2593676 RepID=UPI0033B22838